MKTHRYYVYILKCSDGSYYTGMTGNLEQRIRIHETGENITCYTYTRRPVALVYYDYFTDVNNAIAFEKQVKGWSRKKKEALMDSDWDKLKILSKNYTEFKNPKA